MFRAFPDAKPLRAFAGNAWPSRKVVWSLRLLDTLIETHGPVVAAEPRPIKLACRNVWKVYGQRPDYYFDSRGYVIDADALSERMRAEAHLPAVVDASFEVATGEIFVIMGLSGSGKSTLVRCLSRLVEPSAGEILLDGRNLLKASAKELIQIRRHDMGMVFQNFGLLPHLTVLENVAFPLKIQHKGQKEREERAREMIALVGLNGREKSLPSQLSGGQQQRVGIARSPWGRNSGSSTNPSPPSTH
jgi:glycine betaine/proline transport system ATP-binding protein